MNNDIESTSDDRIKNNAMRHRYRRLTDNEKNQMQNIKDMGLGLYSYIESLGSSRELSLAKTRVQEAVMWAVNHITK